MEQNQTPSSAEDYRRMPYSELKKLAKKRGIKGNLKAEKIIESLLATSMDSEDLDSFSTPAQNLINSSRKNKEEKFNEDLATPLATPRRGTYSLGSPIILKAEEETSNNTDPSDNEKPAETDEEKVKTPLSAADTTFENVTLERGSERKLRPRKVSFVSPVVTPRGRRNSSLKLRPKTPVASRPSLVGKLSPTPVKGRRGSLRKSIHLTPRPRNSLSEANSSRLSAVDCETPLSQIIEENLDAKLSQSDDISSDEMKESINKSARTLRSALSFNTLEVKGLDEELPLSDVNQSDKINSVEKVARNLRRTSQTTTKTVEMKESDLKLPQSNSDQSGSINLAAHRKSVSTKKKQLATPISRNFAAGKEAMSLKKQLATPSPRTAGKENASLKKKQFATPNFKKIHEKAFEKMESIDDYHKRKMDSVKKVRVDLKSRVTKAKSKIPAFSGIPFIPSTRRNLPKELKIVKPVADKKDTPRPDLKSIRKKTTKFDLKSSLSRKLGYTPYTGPLKPLGESSNLNSSSIACAHTLKPVNPVVSAKRTQNRVALKGVRTNKRFELQMKNRKL